VIDLAAVPPEDDRAVRTGLIAAGLASFAAVVLLTGGGHGRSATVEHTCSATDRQFISKTELSMTALGIWGDDYRRGEATEAEVIAEARRATVRVETMNPSDPALRKTKTLMAGMLTEYGRAMVAKAKQKDAAPHMYRAYGLANFAHEVLAEAQPELRRRGCDVSSLL
jgi:Flp pilus assembly protein TadD